MKNKDPLVSIIVPVYGTEAYLPACIESICRQTYNNIEIILVDDQSPDGCPEICDTYADKDGRIRVIHQNNKGVSGARNTGMDHASGDYVMFVDSDDELYSDAVNVLLNDAEEYDADVVSALKIHEDMNGTTVSVPSCEKKFVYRNHEPLLLSLEGDHNTDSACAKLYKRSFVHDLRFEEGKNINEDGFFVFQCYIKKPLLVQHDIAVYQYNSREESGSRQTYSDKYLSMLHFCNLKKEKILSEYPQYTDQAYNMEVRTHLYFLEVLCRTNDKRYRDTHKESVETVRRLYKYHKPIHNHHRKFAWIVAHGLYSLYKIAVRFKYYR